MPFTVENNVIKTEDPDFDCSKLGGLGTIIFNDMKKYKNNVAQIDPDTDREDTYGLVLRHSIRTALVMKYKGVRKGDILLGCSDNHMDACVPIIAAMFFGAIPCSLDPSMTPLEMKEIIKQIKPKMIFTIPLSVQVLEHICRDLKLDVEIVVFGTSDNHPEFRTFLERQIGEDEFEAVVSDDPYETAIIYVSSGTSGLAKVCCLSHAYFIIPSRLVPDTSIEHLDLERRNFEWSQFKRGGAFLCYSPLCWITGGKMMFQSIFMGGTRVLCKKFYIKRFWEIVEKYRIWIVALTPYYVSQLAKCGLPSNVNVERLFKIITCGAALQVTHCKILQDMLPDVDIVQSYGVTETGVITGFEEYNKVHREYYKRHPDCLGYPLKGIWYKIVDPDTNEVLGPNQEGELLVKSKYFMNGYYGQPADNVFDVEGWFRTGDVVFYTDDGAFYVTDRLKDLMRYQYLNLYPYVIEKELYKHPAVAQAVVLGVPHVDDVERPAAFVVLHKDFEGVTAEELRTFADERAQDKAKLRGGVRIVESVPMTSTGKVKKRELRRLILEKNK